MRTLFVDTSAFLAVSNRGDRHHQAAAEFFESIMNGKVFTRIVTTDYIVDETVTRLRFVVGHEAALKWLKDIQTSAILEILKVDEGTFGKAVELFEKYSDKTLSFTDCTSFALMEEKKIRSAFTFDADFEKVGFKVYPE